MKCIICNGNLVPIDYEMLGGDIIPAWECKACDRVQGSEIMQEVMAKTSYVRKSMTLAERLDAGLKEVKT